MIAVQRYLNYREKINFEKVYLYLFIGFAFSIPLSRSAISMFVILIPLVWAYEGEFKRKWEQIRSSKLLLAMIAYIGVIGLSVLWSTNVEEALKVFRISLYWLVIFVAATSLDKKHIPSILSGFLVAIFISEVIAYGVFFEIWSFKDATPDNPTPFMSHLNYSLYLAVTSVVLFNRLVVTDYSNMQKLFFLLFFISTTTNLFLIGGRTGQAAFLFGVFVMFFVHFRFSSKAVLASLLSLSVIYTVAYNFSDTFQQRVASAYSDVRDVLDNQEYDSSWGIRMGYWPVSFDAFKQSPLAGHGAGDYAKAIHATIDKESFSYLGSARGFMKNDIHPHNQFLLVLLQLGLFGLVIVSYLWYQIFKTAYCIKDKEQKAMFLAAVTIFFVVCFAIAPWYRQFGIAIWVLLMSVLSIYSFSKKD